MRVRIIFSISVLLLLSFACSSDSSNENLTPNSGSNYKSEQKISKNSNQQQLTRKLIKKGSIEFETNDLKRSKQNILSAVKKYNAYISSENEFKYSSKVKNKIEVRVPSNNFDSFLIAATLGVDKFIRKEINLNDVTEEFLDIEARLKTKKEIEQRYRQLLQKAKTITDILEIEKKIGELRTEIESIEGRLNYLNNQVSLSTITFEFYEEFAVENGFGNKFSDSFINGWDNLVLFLITLTNIWPFILITISILFYLWIRKKK